TTKLKSARSATGDQKNEEARGWLVTSDMRLDDSTIEPCEAIRHFTYSSRHGSRARSSASQRQQPTSRQAYRAFPALRDHACCFDPRVRRARGIDRLSAAERKGGGYHLGPRPRALSQNQMARPRKSSRHPG